jgi:sugar O-acyltransferase (sialic acid O-acetyltransferase NeuD family)
MKTKLIIFGVGEIGQLAHYYFSTDSAYEVAAFTVDAAYAPESREFCGLPVVPFEELESHFAPSDHHFFAAVSYSQLNRLREAKVDAAKARGYAIASYISSHATVLTREPIGENAFILEDNTIQPFARIGRNVTLWSGNHIGHHSSIGDHCFLASHIVVSGGVTIEDHCFIGVNATIRNAVKIGSGCVIAMSAVINGDCEADGLYTAPASERSKIPASRLRKL